jgi:hypothetical protein
MPTELPVSATVGGQRPVDEESARSMRSSMLEVVLFGNVRELKRRMASKNRCVPLRLLVTSARLKLKQTRKGDVRQEESSVLQ